MIYWEEAWEQRTWRWGRTMNDRILSSSPLSKLPMCLSLVSQLSPTYTKACTSHVHNLKSGVLVRETRVLTVVHFTWTVHVTCTHYLSSTHALFIINPRKWSHYHLVATTEGGMGHLLLQGKSWRALQKSPLNIVHIKYIVTLKSLCLVYVDLLDTRVFGACWVDR